MITGIPVPISLGPCSVRRFPIEILQFKVIESKAVLLIDESKLRCLRTKQERDVSGRYLAEVLVEETRLRC